MGRSGLPRIVALAVVCLAAIVAIPSESSAQSTIAGAVKDSTGAVLPGVTVEASSPVLIEKSRSVITDGEGLYRVVDLRPGIYTVTFTLPGFNTVVRDAIELPANFTANVSVDMRVGAVEETITVSGVTPVVDVQSAVTQNTLNRDLLDSVPTGRSYHMAAVTTPGVQVSRVDVGGAEGFFYTNLIAHGSLSRDQAIQLDGMSTVDGEGSGEVQGLYRDDADNEEIVFQTSALPAEVSQGGVRINMIGKEGSNALKGAVVLDVRAR